MRGLRVLLIGIASIVGVGLGMPFCGTQTETAHDKCIRGVPADTVDVGLEGWSWSPLGTRCFRVDRDSRRYEQVVPPWRGDAWD